MRRIVIEIFRHVSAAQIMNEQVRIAQRQRGLTPAQLEETHNFVSRMWGLLPGQYRNEDFHAELRFLSITSSPAFVRTPEGSGVAEAAFVQGAAAVDAHIPDRRRPPPCTPRLVTPL